MTKTFDNWMNEVEYLWNKDFTKIEVLYTGWNKSLINLLDTRKIVEHKFCCPEIPDHVVIAYAEFSSIFGEVVCTGSRAIGGWKDDSDYDFVVAVDGNRPGSWWDAHRVQIVQRFGAIWNCRWSGRYHESVPAPDKLCCMRTMDTKPIVNLIIDFRGRKMLENWMIATDAAIERCALTREERVKIFEEMGT